MSHPDNNEKNAAKKELHKKITYLPDIHRLLPQSIDAEQGVLGSLLLAPEQTLQLCQEANVEAAWFHMPAHGVIFEMCEKILSAKQPLDFITLTQHLRDLGLIDQVGGAAFVTGLFTFLPTAANAGYYLAILAEKHALRRLIAVCTEYAARAYDEQDAAGELVDEAQQAILAVNRPDSSGTEAVQHIAQAAAAAVRQIESIYANRGGVMGLPTGYTQIDRMTGGALAGQSWIIAGRPSMGKTALLMNMAEHVAIALQKPVLVFSAEMTITELASRMVCGRAKVNLQRVRDGFLKEHQMAEMLPKAVKAVALSPIHVDDTAGISIQELRTRARRFKKKNPKCAAIFIDYLQKLKSNSAKARNNREIEIAEISDGIKNLARELGIPIFTGAQLNRTDDGPKSPPKLSNLRESGSIEQDADVVLILHRKWYYTRDDEDLGKANVNLAKQRNGPVGDVALAFVDELGRFENPEGQAMYSNNPAERQH